MNISEKWKNVRAWLRSSASSASGEKRPPGNFGAVAISAAVATVALGLAATLILFDASPAMAKRKHKKHKQEEPAPISTVAPAQPAPVQPQAAAPSECEVPKEYKKLSKCVIGGAGADKDDAVIGESATDSDCKRKVYFDTENRTAYGKITIDKGGELKFFDRKTQLSGPVSLTTAGIDVTGTLELGDAKCPIGTINPAAQLVVTFTGDAPGPNNRLCKASPCQGWVKGIQVESGGTLRMWGSKGVPSDAKSAQLSWTYLRAPAGPTTGYTAADKVKAPVPAGGNTTLKLAYDVSPTANGSGGWRKGDWIAVATTSFSPWETEFVRLKQDAVQDKVNGQVVGSIVTIENGINTPSGLQYYHFGGVDPAGSVAIDATTNYGVDERAEVGLISRSIKLTSDAPLLPASLTSTLASHWGGELKILPGFSQVSIQGVELEKFGKEQLGSYPIHFHMDGDVANKPLINANSIHHSYNKCMTVHSTRNLTIQNNVCARITGHIFYEEIGDEVNIKFDRNVGMSAMSNSFDINAVDSKSRCDMVKKYYWKGDNMAPGVLDDLGSGVANCRPITPDIGFNQIGIFDTDDQTAPVHGICGHAGYNGKFEAGPLTTSGGTPDNPIYRDLPNCAPPDIYFEAPSGFWITNPSAKITSNSIAGCQDTGRSYYYVPPGGAVGNPPSEPKWIPIGSRYSSYGSDKFGIFKDNRGHGCYSGLYDEPENVVSDSLFGYEQGIHDNKHDAVADEFENFTLSRIRDRGIWVRPSFYVANKARLATIRDAASLVTSGGVDGNYPGVFGLLSNSIVVGISTNNVDRWGPCPKRNTVSPIGQVSGGEWGCIDQTNPNNTPPCNAPKQPACKNTVNGATFTERGYDTPDWPMFGFLIYDGPPLILNDTFINFRVAPGSQAQGAFKAADLLTKADDDVLKTWPFYAIPNQPAYSAYEGDAALGWFNANQSSYPAASTTEKLTFVNVDLRHQVYTAAVNRGDFTDGDQNTTILDLDGTLAGVTAKDSTLKKDLPSISLNNLPINASSNSVDECMATGSQDALLEGRPTAAMAPSALGQLEFEQLYPNYTSFHSFRHTETLTFTKNVPDFSTLFPAGYHGSMALKSRDGKGDWEPKVTAGYGYMVTASAYTAPDGAVAPPTEATCPGNEKPCSKPGIGPAIDLTLTDIVNAPNISKDKPFYIQLGICYTDENGKHPADKSKFRVTRGYRSYGGGNVVTSPSVSDALKKFWTGFLPCNNLDFITTGGDDKKSNVLPPQCPSVSGNNLPVASLTAANSFDEFTDPKQLNAPPTADNLTRYFYDEKNGWLFVWLYQDEPNAQGQSPLGNCKGNANDAEFCPENTTHETYYVCPAQGCPSYRVVLNDSSYKPGPSACGDPYGAGQGYSWPGPPKDENVLVVAGTNTPVVRTEDGGKSQKFPHYATSSSVSCPQ